MNTVQLRGKEYRLLPDAFDGAVDYGQLLAEGARVCGWAVKRSNGAACSTFEIVIANSRAQSETSNVKREDVKLASPYEDQMCGFSSFLPLDALPKPLNIDINVYAVDEDNGIATLLPKHRPKYHLDLPIKSASDFVRLIQTPSTRIENPITITMAAYHALDRLPRDFIVKSGALCVIGYRMLEGHDLPKKVSSAFWSHSEAALNEAPSLDRGVVFRWKGSIGLLRGYLALQQKNIDEAVNSFSSVYAMKDELQYWPTALTNVLLCIYMTAYLKYRRGEIDEAVNLWATAGDLFKFGCANAKFSNVYAYGEVRNALQVAEECHVCALVAKTAEGKIVNPALGPIGRAIRAEAIPGPFSRLVKLIEQHR